MHRPSKQGVFHHRNATPSSVPWSGVTLEGRYPLNSGLWVRRLLMVGAPFHGWCPPQRLTMGAAQESQTTSASALGIMAGIALGTFSAIKTGNPGSLAYVTVAWDSSGKE